MTARLLAEIAAVVLAAQAIAWLATYLLHSTLAVMVALAADRWARRAPAQRALAWRTALLLPPVSATLRCALPLSPPFAFELRAVPSLLGPRPVVALALVFVVALGVYVSAALLLAGWARARWLLRTRQSAGARQGALLARLGDGEAPALTVSRRLLSPAALGSGEICLPSVGFEELPEPQRLALLAHELAHLRRRDPLWLTAAALVAGTLFLQPLNRVALARLREASEDAADDLAVGMAGCAPTLARALAAVATMVVTQLGSTAAAGSPLLRRVRRLLGDGPANVTTSSAGRWLVAASLLLVLATPGIHIDPDTAANAIPWLAPSHEPPNARMLAVRELERSWCDGARRLLNGH